MGAIPLLSLRPKYRIKTAASLVVTGVFVKERRVARAAMNKDHGTIPCTSGDGVRQTFPRRMIANSILKNVTNAMKGS